MHFFVSSTCFWFILLFYSIWLESCWASICDCVCLVAHAVARCWNCQKRMAKSKQASKRNSQKWVLHIRQAECSFFVVVAAATIRQISLHFWQRLVSLSFGTHLDFEWFVKNESKNTDKPFSRVAESMKRDPKHVLYAARTNVLHKRKEQAETNGKERIEKPADNHTNQQAKCKSKSDAEVNEERWAIRSNKSV